METLNVIEYPQCFIIRDKVKEEAIWFVVIHSEEEDLQLQPYHQDFLLGALNAEVEITTLAEAETYGAFELAPIGSSADFTKWLDDEIAKATKTNGNLLTGTNKLCKDEYPTYYMVLGKEEFKAICVFRIRSEEENIELPLSWWTDFNTKMHLREIEYGSYENSIATRVASEYNVQEFMDAVENFNNPEE